MIEVDIYEPKDYQERIADKIQSSVIQLEVGDYSFKTSKNALVIIERKTPSDLVASLGSGRLQDQLLRIRNKTDLGFLLIDGTFSSSQGFVYINKRKTNWRLSQILNFLVTAQSEGIYVNWLGDSPEFPEYIVSLFTYYQKIKHVGLIKPTSPDKEVHAGQRVLMAVPHIGYERALSLIEKFGTVQNVANASRFDLLACDKMTPQAADSLMEVLHV